LLTELGVTQRQLGRLEDAMASYAKAVVADPDYPPANRNLAVLLDLYLDDPVRALPYLERYQAQVGEDKLANAWVADLRQRAGRKAPAPTTATPASGEADGQGGATPDADAQTEGQR
jgi:Flp pilus assembly protein TadD